MGRNTEAVPVGDPVNPDMPLRDHVMVPLQDAVQRPGRGDQGFPVLCIDDFVDERVDCRVFNANRVTASLTVCGGRAPVIALFV